MLNIGKNRCQRIMSKNGIRARREKDGYDYAGKSDDIYANILLTDEVSNYSEIYFSDMFEFKLVDGTEIHGCFIFSHDTRQVLSIIFDYFDDATLVERTLDEASCYIQAESVFHVDQGCLLYTSPSPRD